MQVSSLVALMQETTVDMLMLDLRDEDDFAQYHLQGGMPNLLKIVQHYLVLPLIWHALTRR